MFGLRRHLNVNAGFRQNLLLQSEDFNTTWAKLNSTCTTNTADTTDPLGGSTADILVEDTTNGQHRFDQVPQNHSSGKIYCVSVYAKTGTRNILGILADGSGKTAYYDLNAGTSSAGAGTVIARKIVSVGNGWYRCGLIYTGSGTGRAFFIATTTAGVTTYAGVASGKALYLWGAQIAHKPMLTQYVKTTTAAVNQSA